MKQVIIPTRMADGTQSLVQVSADVDAPSTLEREVRALTEAAAEFPYATLHLVTLARPAGRIELPGNIELAEASQWFLQ